MSSTYLNKYVSKDSRFIMSGLDFFVCLFFNVGTKLFCDLKQIMYISHFLD